MSALGGPVPLGTALCLVGTLLRFAFLTSFTYRQHLCVHAWMTSPALDTEHVAVGDSCENAKIYQASIILCSLEWRKREYEICQSDDVQVQAFRGLAFRGLKALMEFSQGQNSRLFLA